jgi:hypothetical protein
MAGWSLGRKRIRKKMEEEGVWRMETRTAVEVEIRTSMAMEASPLALTMTRT